MLRVPSLAVIFGCGMLGACGSPDGGGTGGTGMATVTREVQNIGAISAKSGSNTNINVSVKGVRFDTAQATITREGLPSKAADLRNGMVVTVQGVVDDANDGRAAGIAYRDRVRGTLTAIDATHFQLTVLGQSVTVDRDTNIVDESTQAPLEFTHLASGDYLEVSGFADAQNRVLATYIGRKPPVANYEVKGAVSQLDTGAKRFRIGGLTVKYDYYDDNADDVRLTNGIPVMVSGDQFDAHDSVLIARQVAGESSNLHYDDGDEEAEIEGVVTAVLSGDRFLLYQEAVQTQPSTVFRNGPVKLNDRITVRGKIDADNVLLADEIEIH